MTIHNAILQRLNSALVNDGIVTSYPADVFSSVNFDGVPVIFCESGPHPEHDMVSSGRLPDGYRVVGRVNHSRISNYGEPRLIADLSLDDEQVSARATAGELSISTAMNAPCIPTADGGRAIASPVTPNHVLIFPRGPDQVPNDAGAYIVNLRAPETEIANKLKVLPSESVKMSENSNTSTPAPQTAAAPAINNLTEPTVNEVIASNASDMYEPKDPATVKRELESMSDEDLEKLIAEAKATVSRAESILGARKVPNPESIGVANLRTANENLILQNKKLELDNLKMAAEIVRLRNSVPNPPAEGYTIHPSENTEAVPQQSQMPGFRFTDDSTFIGSGRTRSADWERR